MLLSPPQGRHQLKPCFPGSSATSLFLCPQVPLWIPDVGETLGASRATLLTSFSFLTLPPYQFSSESSSPPSPPSSGGQAATFPTSPLPRRSRAAHRPALLVSPGAHPQLSGAGGDHPTLAREKTASPKAVQLPRDCQDRFFSGTNYALGWFFFSVSD